MKKIILFISLLFIPGISFAEGNLKYLGFEFGKEPDPEYIKNFKCSDLGSFKECYNSIEKDYSVILDKNNIVRKVYQSISTSSSSNSFNCLNQIQSYAHVLNDDYHAGITIPSNGLFDKFEATIYKNNIGYLAYADCKNLAEDIRFNASIEDYRYNDEYNIDNDESKNTSDNSIKRDFEW